MTERTLHFIWENQYFDKQALQTQNGDAILIRHPGEYNKLDAGPDFAQAEVEINGICWVGQLEIHLKSSDWLKHKHQDDDAYANVILHVVYEHDKEIINQEGNPIPTIELRSHIPAELMQRINILMNRSEQLPCHAMIDNVSDIKIHQWLDRLAVERLNRKSKEVLKCLQKRKGDWEATYIDTLFKYMGFKVNNDAFLMLSHKIDWRWIQKNAANDLKIEAFLLGLAGFLQKQSRDEYEEKLRNEFNHLKRLLGLKSLPLVSWKFSRMRPSNYPSLRIAQLASLFHAHSQLFPDILNRKKKGDFYAHFDIEYPDYWKVHYAFGKESSRKREKPGRMSIHLLLINVVAPVLYAYGKYTGAKRYCNRSINLWQSIPAENNRIIRKWKKIDIKAEHAWDSQALISLFKNYCTDKRCLECQIGQSIVGEAMKQYEDCRKQSA